MSILVGMMAINFVLGLGAVFQTIITLLSIFVAVAYAYSSESKRSAVIVWILISFMNVLWLQAEVIIMAILRAT